MILLDELELISHSKFPSPDVLNELTSRYHKQWTGPVFKGQSQFSEDEQRYYETIISEDGVVPTREQSWHDLFNALIWLQFPKTKSLLNELHISDIEAYGVNPRTARRNRITHFDECGVVLAIEEPRPSGVESLEVFLQQLATHEWEQVFLKAPSFVRRACRMQIEGVGMLNRSNALCIWACEFRNDAEPVLYWAYWKVARGFSASRI